MHPDIENLLKITVLDTEIVDLMNLLEELPLQEKAESSRLDSAKAKTAQAEEDFKNFRKAVNEKELELKTIDANVKKYDAQLNTIKKNDEFAAVKGQINKLRDEGKKLEEVILRAMEQVEQKDKETKKIKEESLALEKEVSDALAALIQRRKEAEARLQTLQTEKDTHLDRVDFEVGNVYKKLFHRYQDVVIVPVDNGVCQGCYMALTPQNWSQVLAANSIQYCRNCGRIVYSRGQ